MKKNCILFLCLIVFVKGFSQAEGDIIISEMMNNPAAVSDSNGEYFELFNTTNASIDIGGWIIEDGNSSETISGTLLIPPLGYVVLAKNSDTAANGGVVADYDYTSTITLTNSNGTLILRNSSNVVIDRVDFDDTTFPIVSGKSMELSQSSLDHISNNSGANWALATLEIVAGGDLGSPGSAAGGVLLAKSLQIEGFNVYPNPVANGSFQITTASNTNKQLTIYSMLGNQVYSKTVEVNEHVNVSHLNSGVYFVNVEENGKTATKKLVIK
ncbi:Por secretion system C-terminal sorting domain-containing protein [Lutibacter oricola]|uniref:Por secretion system C-terminal sorting domain-containing protein n=1 Tax=Lutibacter oricola TaxID=762486 RepID=A0A1H3DD34_9FLAO|nr:T9SS type A sorting domain-containing protein [Lutibacter oricola]SDX64301.1 Por secretion system C-terminal sorting domain-containing protein [Lutibacter oricola]